MQRHVTALARVPLHQLTRAGRALRIVGHQIHGGVSERACTAARSPIAADRQAALGKVRRLGCGVQKEARVAKATACQRRNWRRHATGRDGCVADGASLAHASSNCTPVCSTLSLHHVPERACAGSPHRRNLRF
jgi:hypothetical protein